MLLCCFDAERGKKEGFRRETKEEDFQNAEESFLLCLLSEVTAQFAELGRGCATTNDTSRGFDPAQKPGWEQRPNPRRLLMSKNTKLCSLYDEKVRTDLKKVRTESA
jgi:hypothetical protein